MLEVEIDPKNSDFLAMSGQIYGLFRGFIKNKPFRVPERLWVWGRSLWYKSVLIIALFQIIKVERVVPFFFFTETEVIT